MKAILDFFKNAEENHALAVLELLFNHNNKYQTIMSQLADLPATLAALTAQVTAANSKLEAVDTAVKALIAATGNVTLAADAQTALDGLTAALATTNTDTAALATDAKVS